MKKFDKIIIMAFLILSLFFAGIYYMNYNKNYDKKYIEIYVDDALYKKVQLTASTKEELDIKTKYGENLVSINSGKVRITDADCPDKVCVKSGAISKPGENVVCLPHKLIVEIKGVRNAETDDLAY